ncbi:MAG: metal-dependent hydrolase [Pirellulales bacterium]|nr:metal-dependent hydrolase [Pirellulales bacterium]
MATRLTWLGHGTWTIETAGTKILLDPFLDDNPTAPVRADDIHADAILVSHGHFDHVADLVKIAKRTDATVIANYEICAWANQQGVEKVEYMNLGGTIAQPWGRVKLTIAHHSSVLPDGTYGGNPGGFLLFLADATIYFACDTALFEEMRTIGSAGIDLAVLPIGDRFTMGPDDSLEAIKRIKPRRVAPAHYNTWPPIAQDASAWAAKVKSETEAEPLVLEPGGTIEI